MWVDKSDPDWHVYHIEPEDMVSNKEEKDRDKVNVHISLNRSDKRDLKVLATLQDILMSRLISKVLKEHIRIERLNGVLPRKKIRTR